MKGGDVQNMKRECMEDVEQNDTIKLDTYVAEFYLRNTICLYVISYKNVLCFTETKRLA